MKITHYILRRLLSLIPTLIGVTLLAFILVRSLPISLLISQYLNPDSTIPLDIQRANAIQSLGLNLPVPAEYFIYLKSLFTGNWGSMTSSFYNGPVLTGISQFFPNTLQLAVFSMFLSIAISIPLGTYMGARPNSAGDHIGRIAALTLYGMPLFWLGLMLQMILGQGILNDPLSVFPTGGTFSYASLSFPPPSWILSSGNNIVLSSPTHILLLDALVHGDFRLAWDAFMHLVSPVLTLTFGLLAYQLRFIRSGVVDSYRQEFTRAAIARGIPEKTVIKKHVRRNGILPSITAMGLIMAFLMGGVVLVEDVFQYPGMGLLSINAVLSFQIYGVMGTTIVFSFVVITANFIVDLLYAKIDPRVTY